MEFVRLILNFTTFLPKNSGKDHVEILFQFINQSLSSCISNELFQKVPRPSNLINTSLSLVSFLSAHLKQCKLNIYDAYLYLT